MDDESPQRSPHPSWVHLVSAVIAALGLGTAGGGAYGSQITAGGLSEQLTKIEGRLDTMQAGLTQVLTYEARIQRLESELRAHVEREGHAESVARVRALERRIQLLEGR